MIRVDTSSDLIRLLKDNSINFSKEELESIIENERKKEEKQMDKELIECCIDALNKIDAPEAKSPKKRSYTKFIVFAAVAAVLFLINFTLLPVLTKKSAPATELSESTVITESTTLPITEKEEKATEKSTEGESVTSTETTRVSTTFKIDINSSIHTPQKILFYENGIGDTLSSDMNKEIVRIINRYLADEYKGSGWKYTAETEMINKIKAEKHMEIRYNKIQSFLAENPADERQYNHILVSLDGQYKNIMFFGTDGKYQSLPIGPLEDDAFTEKILSIIYDK